MVEVRGQVEGEAPRAAAKPTGGSVVISDVWSRSGSKYRVRAIVLLLINMLLFACLGCFAFWLRTGHYLAPALNGYWTLLWQTCLPGSGPHTLTSMLTFPINLQEVPLQIVIHGLLLSALVSIPLLVSILYRFYCCLPFVAVVGLVALMPWLALTLLGSCILASVKPFRFSFRYASALLGLVLVVVYFLAVSLQSQPATTVLANPGERVTLVAPWILAVLSSCVLLGLGLGLAKLVNYRPGVIAPLLATMFALPIALFEEYVGRDELYYRLLEHDYGPKSAYFQDRDVQEMFDRNVERAHDAKPDGTYEAIASLQDTRWQFGLESTPKRRNPFAWYREQAARDCAWFVKHFPLSRHAPSVLYLMGRALDMRVDLAQFRSDKRLVFYDTFPSTESREAWLRLWNNATDSPLSAVALYRLAMLDAREGKVDQAVAYLREQQRFAEPAATTQASPAGGIKGSFRCTPPESGLQVSVEGVVFEGKRLLSILENNRDPLYGDDPITGPTSKSPFPRLGWMLFDPQDGRYRENLTRLLERYPGCQLTDNIEVERARTLEDPHARIAALRECIKKYTGKRTLVPGNCDAVPEAWFRLGESEFKADKSADARQALEHLIEEYPDSIWRELAERRLATLGPAPVEP